MGCATGLYCPDAFVTRAQMALFMQRLGKVFTDHSFTIFFGGGAPLDPDASPIVCDTTTSPYTPTYPETASAGATVAILSAGLMNTQAQIVYSTDGGTNWTGSGNAGGPSLSGASGAGVWYRNGRSAEVAMNVGPTYVFGIRVTRVSGTADGTDYRCGITVSPINRNPLTGPLRTNVSPPGRR